MSDMLHLTLHRKWFDMILRGEKLEEYRAITPYWNKRLRNRNYAKVKFTNGYGAHRPWMIVRVLGHFRGLGIVEWGATPREVVHILRLGGVIESGNLKEESK